MVSENGSTWYELAGSVFYDDSTTWNAEVTYQYNADSTTYELSDGRSGAFNFVFNKLQGGSLSENYPLAAAKGVIDEENNKVTLKGTLITEMYPAFGYADVKSANPQLHEEASPYAENQNSADGFDLKWAVDPETGNPVDLSNAEIHYVKVYTANFSKGETNIGEQSTEVSYIVRQTGEEYRSRCNGGERNCVGWRNRFF